MQNEQHEDEDIKNMKVIMQTTIEAALSDVLDGSGTMMKSLGLSARDGFGVLSAALGKMLFKLCEAGLVKKDEPMDVRILDRTLRLSVHVVHAIARDQYPAQMEAITKAAQGSVSNDAIDAFKAKINGGLN